MSVAEVNPLHRKLMLSIINGQHNLQMRKIHVRSPAEAHRPKTTRVLPLPVLRRIVIDGMGGVHNQAPLAGRCVYVSFYMSTSRICLAFQAGRPCAGGKRHALLQGSNCKAHSSGVQQQSVRVLTAWRASGGRWCGICEGSACRACSGRAQQQSLRADGLLDGRRALVRHLRGDGLQSLQQQSTALESACADD